MNQLGGFPLLTLIVFLPILGAVMIAFVPSGRQDTWRWLAFLLATAVLFISFFLYMGWVDDPGGALQFVDGPWPWIPGVGIQYHLGIDGINLHLALLTTLLTPVALWLAWPWSSKAQVVGILLFETGMLGAITALDLFLFYAFWLLAMLAMFFLIGSDAHDSSKTTFPGAAGQSWAGAMRFMIAMVIAATCMLAVIVGLLALRSGFDLPDLLASPADWRAQVWLFWGMTLALGISGAIFPLHLWQAGIGRSRSPATLVLIDSLLINLGGYGLVRFCLTLFPLAAVSFAPVLVALGAVGMVYGAFAALGSSSLAGKLAYWNVSQMGLSVMGIFSFQNLGVHGAVAHFVGRGLSVAALLLLSKSWEAEAHVSPRSRVALALAFLSTLGVPGLAGFTGQSMLVLGILRWHWQGSASGAVNRLLDWTLYLAIGLGLLVGMWALLRLWRRVPRLASSAAVGHAFSRETLIVVPILIAILFFGLRPQAFSDMTGPSVFRLLGDVNAGVQESLYRMASPTSLEGMEGGFLLPLNQGVGEPGWGSTKSE